MSRLGDPAPQARSGAARFATPKHTDAQTLEGQNVEAAKRQDVKTSIVQKQQKQPMTIRFTPEAIDRLAELERHLRRAGIRARQASASEILEALIFATTPEIVQELIGARK